MARHRQSGLAGLWLAATALWGCPISGPAAPCVQPEDCPPGYLCDFSANFCYRGPVHGDATLPSPELPASDAAVLDAASADRARPDAVAPDLSLPDTQQPDQSAPDTYQPDQSAPDTHQPDQSAPDTQQPDQSAPDTQQLDRSPPDKSHPDQSAPDTPQPDQSAPDTPQPDGRAEDATVSTQRRCQDLNCLLDALAAADVSQITLSSGTYLLSETLEITRPLTLRGVVDSRPVLDGQELVYQVIYVKADDVTIEGLELTGNTDEVDTFDEDLIKAEDPPVRNLVIRDCLVRGSIDDGIELKYCTDCLIERCQAWDCQEDGFAIVNSSVRGTVRDSLVANSGSQNGAIVLRGEAMAAIGNAVRDSSAKRGIHLSGSSGVVVDNLIYRNTFSDNGIVAYGSPGAFELLHNTVAGNTYTNTSRYDVANAIVISPKATDTVLHIRDNLAGEAPSCGILIDNDIPVPFSGTLSHNAAWANGVQGYCGDLESLSMEVLWDDDPLFDPATPDPCWDATYTLSHDSPYLGRASDDSDVGVRYDRCR